MDVTMTAAWIQAIAALVIAGFTAATGWLFYQISLLHKRISDLRDFSGDLMRDHEKENRDFRESIIRSVARLEALANGRKE